MKSKHKTVSQHKCSKWLLAIKRLLMKTIPPIKYGFHMDLERFRTHHIS